ncbi:HAMP domain-containing histidine kinase [Alkaliphilus serpentinus]|uniref:histidine kinase n=1 Tax=Alkaliphilus serpentinus TaxID=1482731 RepID=A0A833HQA0_9FIRM|nr:HAMP domain-containing histidine kinase [Alkaliphilus serpentinus]
MEEAREYEALRNHFLANISHELRTPLNVILSAQQIIHSIIHNDGVEGNKINKILRHNNTIKQNCFRLIRLLNNIIDITKIDIGSLSLDVHNHNIVQVVEDITLSVVTFAEAKNISIIFDTEVEECLVACDPEKIERIMLNLLSNAIKFTPSEGYIYVNIYIQANMVVISVKDTGMGIPYEMHDKVFQRFVQVDSSMKRRQEGSGIGLSLVKLLVELHNGSIRLVSALGKGSEFIIELPITIIDDTQITSNIKASDATNNDKIERVTIEFSDIYF